jgi:hypothetical protein
MSYPIRTEAEQEALRRNGSVPWYPPALRRSDQVTVIDASHEYAGREGLVLDDFSSDLDPPPTEYRVMFSSNNGLTLDESPIVFNRDQLESWRDRQ